MNKMITPRAAKQCPCGRDLLPAGDEKQCRCDKCGWDYRIRQHMHCNQCGFALCQACWSADEGRIEISCPYQKVEADAISFGKAIASRCGFLHVGDRCVVRGGVNPRSEYAPQLYREGNNVWSFGFWPDAKTKVLHGGVRLVVRYDNRIKSMLRRSEDVDTLNAMEVDQVCDKGMTLDEMDAIGHALLQTEFWSLIVEEWPKRYAPELVNEWHGTGPLMEVKSLDIETAVFQISIKVELKTGLE